MFVNMRILVACEYSARVRDAFRRRGHDAWSCDLLPTEGDPKYHFQLPVEALLNWQWDMLIAHPPCTYMANSGAKHLYVDANKRNGPDWTRWLKMYQAADFFKLLWHSNIQHIAVENPVMMGYAQAAIGCPPSQTIQPYEFGHLETKRTCLWLKGLPPLYCTNNVYHEMMKLPEAERAKIHHAPPGKDRWKFRSRTYQGIADAMAAQWS